MGDDGKQGVPAHKPWESTGGLQYKATPRGELEGKQPTNSTATKATKQYATVTMNKSTAIYFTLVIKTE